MNGNRGKTTLRWIIQNFDMGDYSEKKCLSSAVFELKDLHNTRWSLQMTPGDGGYIKVELCRSDDISNLEILRNISISVVGHKHLSFLIGEANDVSFKGKQKVGFSADGSEIFKRNDYYWPHNHLTVECDMWERQFSGSVLPSVIYSNTTDIITTVSYVVFEIPRHSLYGITSPEICISDKKYFVTCNDCYFKLPDTPKGVSVSIHNINRHQRNIISRPINGSDFFDNCGRAYICFDSSFSNTFYCVFRISDGKSITFNTINQEIRNEIIECSVPQTTSSNSLLSDLKRLYSDHTLSDFSLHVQWGEIFKVHSIVLAARSPVFRAMFEADMAEKCSKVVDIPDVDKETLRLLLQFVYTDEVDPLEFESAQKLYVAADKYQIPGLKSRGCKRVLFLKFLLIMNRKGGKITLCWLIRNFDMGDYSEKKCLSSAVFVLANLYDSRWILQMVPGDGEYSRLDICRSDRYQLDILLDLSISVVGHQCSSYSIGNMKEITFKEEHKVGFFVKGSEIFRNKDLYWPHNDLTVQCDMWEKSFLELSSVIYYNTTEILTSLHRVLFVVRSGDGENRSSKIDISGKTCLVKCLTQGLNNTISILKDTPNGVSVTLFDIDGSKTVRLNHYINGNAFFENNITKSYFSTPCTFHCEFRISSGESFAYSVINQETNDTIECSAPQTLASNSLLADLKRLYSDHILSDFSLQLQCGEVFKVHSYVLAARSPVFRAMFEADMAEKASKVVDIPDVDKETLRLLLQFVYTDEVDPLDSESAKKLYIAAHKYQIPVLQSKCSECMMSELSLSNFADILVLGEMHHDFPMKVSVLYFIFKQKDELLISEEWKSFQREHFDLASETFKAIYKQLMN